MVKKISEIIEKNFQEQVEFLSQLVKTRSDNRYSADESPKDVGVEKAVAKLIENKLQDIGLQPQRIGPSEERFNVVAEWGSIRGRKSLILNGHMDTIPPLNEEMVTTYFMGVVRRGRMYGLGVLDMKASLSAYIYAVKALQEAGIELAGRLILEFVVDEEPGACSKWGTEYLLEKGIRAKAAIIGEPGSEVIGIGHRGGYRFKLIVKGEGVHTGLGVWERGEKGRNAAVDMARAIVALKDLEIPYKPARLFPKRKPVFTFPTKLVSGHAVNVVPKQAEGWGDVRLMPGNSDRQVKMLIIERLQNLGIDFDIEDLLFVPAVEIDEKEEIVQLVSEQAEAVLGKKPVTKGVGPWNDAWMFIKRDIPAICGFGPDGGGEHGEEEYVELESLRKVTEVYARVIREYLG